MTPRRFRDLSERQHNVINVMRAFGLPLRWRLALISRWRRPAKTEEDGRDG